MYSYTSSSSNDTDLAQLACRAFVGLSVVISGIGFWHKGIVPFVLLSVFMVATVYLLSVSLTRAVASYGRDWRMFAQTSVLAIGFCLLEGFLNHIGLEHLNSTYELGPAAFASWGSALLPIVNVFASDTYTRDIPKVEGVRPAVSADEAVFGGKPEQPLAPVIDLFKAPPAQPVRFGTSDELQRNQAAIAAIRERMGAAN